tara:strand:- start:29 stop:424 length:396 start_codon:yes stop_codon:yes gene_type:complete
LNKINISNLSVEIAKAADLIFKPYIHSVTIDQDQIIEDKHLNLNNEYFLKLFCRDIEGERIYEYDLDLEIYQSGLNFSLLLSSSKSENKPILWYSKHPIWMESETGQKCKPPSNFNNLESFARKISSLLIL